LEDIRTSTPTFASAGWGLRTSGAVKIPLRSMVLPYVDATKSFSTAQGSNCAEGSIEVVKSVSSASTCSGGEEGTSSPYSISSFFLADSGGEDETASKSTSSRIDRVGVGEDVTK
jgi:hypothetical protein